jgi:alpha-N-arabinofuranosidase
MKGELPVTKILLSICARKISLLSPAFLFLMSFFVFGCTSSHNTGNAENVFTKSNAENSAAKSDATSTSASATVSTKANIVINAQNVLRIIPKELFGTNIEWPTQKQFVWIDGNRASDPKVIELSRAMGVFLVRFPGGTFSDYYDWRKGVGNYYTRPAQNFVLDAGSAPNYFGTDELMSFCRSIGAEPMLTVNLITSNAQSASDWVSYCNSASDMTRIQNGNREPYRVKWWELGNESYMKQDAPSTKASSLSPEAYVERSRQFIAAMRRVDPSIKIGAIGGNNFTRFPFIADNRWNEVVLRQLGNQIDFFSVHNGYAPLVIENTDYSTEQLYSALLAFPVTIEKNFRTVCDEIDRFVPNNSTPNNRQRIKIAVTEWGPLFHISNNNKWVDHPKTLGSGLFTASVLNAMLRNPRVSIATFFKLKDVLFMGTIGYNNVPKGSFYPLQLYSKLAGSYLVNTETQCEKYNTQDVGLMPAVNNVPVLDVITAKSIDGKKLSVYAINKSMFNSIKAHISLNSFMPKTQAKVFIFTGKNIDANNGKDIPDVPGYTWAKQARASRNPQFDRGRPGELSIREKAVSLPSLASATKASIYQMDYVFEPHSLTVIELNQ